MVEELQRQRVVRRDLELERAFDHSGRSEQHLGLEYERRRGHARQQRARDGRTGYARRSSPPISVKKNPGSFVQRYVIWVAVCSSIRNSP